MVTSYHASSFQYGSSDPSGIVGDREDQALLRRRSRASPPGPGNGAATSAAARHAMLAHTMAPTESATAAAT